MLENYCGGLLHRSRPLHLVLQPLRLFRIGLLLQPHKRIECRARLFRLLLAAVELCQLVVRLSQRFRIGVRRLRNHRREIADGILDVSQLGFGPAQLVMRVGIIRTAAQDLHQQVGCCFRLGPLDADHGEFVHRRDTVWIALQFVLELSLRFLQLILPPIDVGQLLVQSGLARFQADGKLGLFDRVFQPIGLGVRLRKDLVDSPRIRDRPCTSARSCPWRPACERDHGGREYLRHSDPARPPCRDWRWPHHSGPRPTGRLQAT